jgi:hypothetical protein
MEKVKTIITRAVYGAAEKECRQTLSLDTYDDTAEHGPQNILGCVVQDMRLSNPVLESKGKGEITVGVRGTYVLHVWYQMGDDTRVFKETVEFSQHITVEGQDDCPYSNEEIRAWLVDEPRCVESAIKTEGQDTTVYLDVVYTIHVEVVGEAAIDVRVFEKESE